MKIKILLNFHGKYSKSGSVEPPSAIMNRRYLPIRKYRKAVLGWAMKIMKSSFWDIYNTQWGGNSTLLCAN